MTAKKKDETKTTDELQNDGKRELEDRIADLEERLTNVIQRNHLLETDR